MAYGNIRPIPEIFTDLVGQVTTLVRKEGQLARAEISEKATRALTGMAMLLLGAMLLIPALVILLQAAVMGLIGNGADPTAAALIVGGAIFLIGMVLGLLGWSRINAGSLVPDKTIDQLKRVAQQQLRDMGGRNIRLSQVASAAGQRLIAIGETDRNGVTLTIKKEVWIGKSSVLEATIVEETAGMPSLVTIQFEDWVEKK